MKRALLADMQKEQIGFGTLLAGQGRGGREEWAGEVDVEHVVFVCGLFKMV